MSLESLRKEMAKAGVTMGFATPTEWLSTGTYAMNFIMSGRFDVAVPNKRMTLLWGQSGSGKSYFATKLAKEASLKGYHIYYLDSETAADEQYMERLGIDPTIENIDVFQTPTIEKATETMSAIFRSLDKEKDKAMIIIDSLSNLLTEKEAGEFDKGIQKGDMGQQAKKLKLFVKNMNSKVGQYDAFILGIGHAYRNQDLMNGEGLWKFSGGDGVEFIPSISVNLNKFKLKEKNSSTVIGVRIKVKVTKSRYTKLGGELDLEVPWETGEDPLSGLLDMAKDAGLVNQAGAWYNYELNGDLIKFQSKNFKDHYLNLFDFCDGDSPVDEESEEEKV